VPVSKSQIRQFPQNNAQFCLKTAFLFCTNLIDALFGEKVACIYGLEEIFS
jgi:hypothetical protein